MPNAPTTRAAVYLRISRDPEGLEAGVERQREDCLALADRLGYVVVATYPDNDAGASSLSRKPRPQYDAMHAAARRGEFEVILAYSNSRLTRRMMELEGLIKLHDETGVRIQTCVSGEDDLATADGRMVARIKASVDAAEAERIGERVRRAHLQRARAGATNHGGRPFGWAEDKLTLEPTEAELIRDAANRVIDGVPLREIARQWCLAGVPTSRGKTWTHTTLRRLLKRPRLAGWRTHHDRIVLDAAGRPVRGVWEPLLDQDTFDRLQVALARDGRGGGRRGARRYLLTGIVRCGVCGGRMNGTTTKTGYAYTCAGGEPSNHTVTLAGPQTDRVIVALVKARLSAEQLPAVETPHDPDAERLAAIPDMIAELMEAFRSRRLSAAVVFPQVEALEAERAELQTKHDRFIVATTVPTATTPEALEGLDVDRLRAVIERLVDAVVIAPASRRGEPWSTDRLTVVWRQS